MCYLVNFVIFAIFSFAIVFQSIEQIVAVAHVVDVPGFQCLLELPPRPLEIVGFYLVDKELL